MRCKSVESDCYSLDDVPAGGRLRDRDTADAEND
jgi:hypothetical protein